MAENEEQVLDENKVLDHVQIKCNKHGDITKGSLFLSYTTVKDEKQINHQNFFCIQCVSDYLSELQQAGKFGQLELVRFFRDKTEEEKNAHPEDDYEGGMQAPPKE